MSQLLTATSVGTFKVIERDGAMSASGCWKEWRTCAGWIDPG